MSYLPNDIIDIIAEMQKSIRTLQQGRIGSVFLDGSITAVDSSGVKTVIGDLTNVGENRVGVAQFVNDTTPPPIPSTPIVESGPGIFSITWDGENEDDEPMAPDFDHFNVYGSSEGVTTLIGSITNESEIAIYAGAVGGTIWRFYLTSVDTNRNESGPSKLSDEYIAAAFDPELEEKLEELATELADAKSSLDQAQQDLADASTNIANIDTRINDAEADIQDALDKADLLSGQVTAAASAASAAQSKADAANSNAATAQSAADAANAAAASAAGIANGKGKVLVQGTAPGAADRNAQTLWIDTTGGANTPKRWVSGTTWTAVTDKAATDAAAAAANAKTAADNAAAAAAAADAKAVAAQTAAGSAQDTANAAMTAAGTKGKVFYGTAAPSGTGTASGDLWRRIDSSKNVIAEWYWTGSAWQSSQITTDAISNLDVGKLTAGSAVIQDAVATKIMAEVIKAKKITTDMLLVGGGDELMPDPYFDGGSAYYTQTPVAEAAMPNHAAGFVMTSNAAGSSNMSKYAPGLNAQYRIPVQPGEVYEGYAWVYSTDGLSGLANTGSAFSGVNLQIYGYNNNTSQSGEDGSRPLVGGNNGIAPTFPQGEWVKVGGQFTIPAGTTYIAPVLTLYFPKSAQAFTGKVYLGRYSIRKAVGSTLIEDGAITTDKIAANAIDVGKLNVTEAMSAKIGEFLELDAGKLTVTGTTHLNEAVANKMFVDIFSSNKITANQLAANSVTANAILAGSITGNKIAANTIDAANIKAGSITADLLNATALTGKQIKGGSLSIDTEDGYVISLGPNYNTPGIRFDTPTTANTSGGDIGGLITADENKSGPGAFSGLRIYPPRLKDFGSLSQHLAIKQMATSTVMDFNGSMAIFGNSVGTQISGDASTRFSVVGSKGGNISWNNSGSIIVDADTNIYLRVLGSSSNISTTSAAANMRLTTSGSGGQLYLTSSVRDAKLGIEDAPDDWADKVLQLRPRTWIDKGNAERTAEYLDLTSKGVLTADEQGRADEIFESLEDTAIRNAGLIAEEVEEAGLGIVCDYGTKEDGTRTLNGIQYSRLTALLIHLAQKQQKTIDSLEARLSALEDKLA